MCTPVGEWQLGPGAGVRFDSRPIALPGTTVDLAWGTDRLRIRILDRAQGYSLGQILKALRAPLRRPRPEVRAEDLVAAGLADLAKANKGLTRSIAPCR